MKIEEYYDPKTNRYPYPEDTASHYLSVKKDNGVKIDKNYPYIDKSKSFIFKQKMVRLLLLLIVFPMTRIRLGLRIEGKENLKKNKDLLKKGVVSVCNHVHMWDYLAILLTARKFKVNLLAWSKNVTGENGTLVRMVGGIPIPENDYAASLAFVNATDKLLKDGGWLHIYSEGSMWEYYRPIRPFKKGAAHFACSNEKPLLPLGFSYRKPSWWRRVFFKQLACYTIHVGEPLFPNSELSKYEQEEDLTIRSHQAICKLVGFKEGENPYEPLYKHSKRIDYYTDKYGIGYKGSY